MFIVQTIIQKRSTISGNFPYIEWVKHPLTLSLALILQRLYIEHPANYTSSFI